MCDTYSLYIRIHINKYICVSYALISFIVITLTCICYSEYVESLKLVVGIAVWHVLLAIFDVMYTYKLSNVSFISLNHTALIYFD